MGDSELQAVQRVLASGILTNGPETEAFEEEFARAHKVPYAVALSNGTVALAAVLLAHGIGPGDEVVVPSFTFISTATAVLHVGALPVFAEIHPDTLTLDAGHAAALITSRTKAVIAVHYAGQAADMTELRAVAERAGVLLFEDAAEAHGATYRGRPVGGLADGGMFSFTPTKNITMGEGGLITTHDAGCARRLRRLRNHGVAEGIPRTSVGYNWRLSEIQAAVGRAQLQKLNGILERKRANADLLAGLLHAADVVFPPGRSDRTPTFMLMTLRSATRRDALVAGLLDRGIEARIYFPPAHLDAVFAARGIRLPRTEQIASTVFSIPFHARLTEDELRLMASEITDLAPRRAA
ncbi:DegT/DnrJ/EryC1/StrS aminotransferase family protein [Nocardia sp. BMG51109]|uniref:DegT/DnrJ/EryC1/StrS family aminotransferase n=1 Tax=Nocardia sp. BMG51109 TaxID=1056816 RepID=UPI0018DB0AD9|nr:DegT/DnrJ/EryC1/StrS family aminotransferase [Nocardia sp. BMG51109]